MDKRRTRRTLEQAGPPSLDPLGLADKWLTPNEAGQRVGVTGEAVKKWIRSRLLPAERMANRYWRIKVSDFEAFLRSRDDSPIASVLIVAGKDKALIEAVTKADMQPIFAMNDTDALLKITDANPTQMILDITCKAFRP